MCVQHRSVGIDFARRAIAAFAAGGATGDLHEIPGVGHTITREMGDELFAHVARAASASR